MSAVVPETPSRPDSWSTEPLEVVDVEAAFADQVQENAGVEVAGAGAHHDAAGRA